MEWQLIETAPVKTRVLVWRPAWRCVCEVWMDDFDRGRAVEPITGATFRPQWWMPLPPPPGALDV
jgi:hypothetical protein